MTLIRYFLSLVNHFDSGHPGLGGESCRVRTHDLACGGS
jgi:hypothetical protein